MSLVSEPIGLTGESRNKRQEVFLELLSDAYTDIEAYVRYLVMNRVDAEDVLQDVCVNLWKSFDQFEFGRSFRAWAAGVAYNVASDYWKQKKRHQGFGLSEAALSKMSRMHTASAEILEMRQVWLRECIDQLPESDRSLVRETYYKASPVTATASRLGKTVSSLYMRLSRIRKKLARCVERKLT
ncbi:MAG: sigma-70 family RNA polymerase sigma factor [Planctomycetota bacterium]